MPTQRIKDRIGNANVIVVIRLSLIQMLLEGGTQKVVGAQEEEICRG